VILAADNWTLIPRFHLDSNMCWC